MVLLLIIESLEPEKTSFKAFAICNRKGTCFCGRLSEVCQEIKKWNSASGSRKSPTLKNLLGPKRFFQIPAKCTAHNTLNSSRV